MRLLRLLAVVGLLGVTLGACARPPSSDHASGPAARRDAMITASTARMIPARYEQAMPAAIFNHSTLAGRTLAVASTSDIILRPGEVVLTFDDGPRPGKTMAILDALDARGVKATFLMLGSAAKAHPELARTVALRGHTVGSHTFDHVDLSKVSRQEAMDEVARGEEAVARALEGAGQGLSPFFRFPYLAQSGFLRTSLQQSDMIILDVDIDSKDYYKESAAAVSARTLAALDARGSGVILFHDIHQRTVDMLPDFLVELEARGYSVVRLVPREPGVFGRSVITAEAENLRGAY